MSADALCRVCLVNNLKLCGVRNELQNVYEIITKQKYNKVGYPVRMCYICLSALRKCHRFMETARDADRLLAQWHKQQNEMGVTNPLSTYSITKIELVSMENKDNSSEHDINQENIDLAEHFAIDIKIEKTECNIDVDTEKTVDAVEPTDNSTMLVDSSTVTTYNDTTQVSDNKQAVPLFSTNMDNEWSGLDMRTQHNDDNSQICQITEVKSEIETNEETQLLSAHETPKDLHTEIEIDETDEGDADDVCHTENSTIKNTKSLKSKYKQNSKRLHICDVCDKCCASAPGLKRHVILKHSTIKKLKKLDQTFKRFSCSFCSYMFTHKSHLTAHIKTHTGEKPFSCDICDYKCTQKSNLKIHIRTHTGEKPFSCDICNFKCSRRSILTLHIRSHTGEKPFSCYLCDYKCTQKPSLTRHIRTHTGEKPLSCDICDFKSTNKSNLIQHIRTHTGEKPFSCDVCDYKCTQISTLNVHIRTHTGEKPFSCDKCDYKATQKSNLIQHIKKSHTGEKPFSCDICDYKSIQKINLIEHIRTHTGEKPFSCDKCDYKAAKKSNLIQHIKCHTGEKPFSCDICDYKCTQKTNLNKHLVRKHGIPSQDRGSRVYVFKKT